jgi:phage terminase large subunit-like protein
MMDTGDAAEPSSRALLAEVGQLADAKFDAFVAAMSDQALQAISGTWRDMARPEQLAPAGDWANWLILAGRGFGKTRAGAGWVHECAALHPGARIALIGATLGDARKVIVEGTSGIKATGTVSYFPSRRLLEWPNGTQATLFSAEEPDTLRGPEFHFAWGDEATRWRDAAAVLANVRLALRLGRQPRLLLTTTPRPLAWLKDLVTDPDCAVVRGRTTDNAANLPPAYLNAIRKQYDGTALGRQEIDGEIIEDLAGALWTRGELDRHRVAAAPPLVRVVVAVDPPAGSGAASDACGIVAVGLGTDGRGYVLADRSVQGVSPDNWARAVVACADDFNADKVIAEVNNGGDMVIAVLQAINSRLPVKAVHASRGKLARAEPVASLYAQGRVAHVGALAALEDEMCGMIVGGVYAGPGRSPDRADALVWALTELMLGAQPAGPTVRVIG